MFMPTNSISLFTPLINKNTVYYGQKDRIYAISIETGEKKWSYQLSGPIIKNPTFYQDILFLVIQLDKPADANVDVYVNQKLVARGEVVVAEDNFGIRIKEVLSKPEV